MRAAEFLEMHRPGAGFILPNAWDGGSARILEQAGFAAIATTSAGIAFSRGRPDASMPRDEMLEEIARIVAVVDCPVSADLESGYGDVAGTFAAAVEIGVLGANLEDAGPDGLFSVEESVERVQAARAAAPAGTFVLNARTDPYMVKHPDAFAESVQRAHRFLEAGADCIFVPGISDAAEIGRLVAEIGAPVNVVAGLTDPVIDAATLRAAGVARISLGGTITRAALTQVDAFAREMLDHGTFDFAVGAIAYGEFQRRFG
ncbi:isocitrate lyase/PEP mutase family protein [Nocardioides marmorisolisilvae]|uniref:Isocitrate lyase/phosphoenolpyruvate mutase family protein n=1 Tax=Nocardioides marmorisolisilvae TaxID=1542737 RepID=A0A3N0DNT4_9ACTN|nr:isocitrate lyase/phosphoenolpyruvate mutase family protein [Nocardioides marmorisolisilvae]RNL77312.1 isocitrate lyase/phosphoenolpyruvate mutase family protein [Nocardioides marmorisolisilvae]